MGMWGSTRKPLRTSLAPLKSTPTTPGSSPSADRSEERRVGKECRSQWSQDQAEDGIRDGRVTGVQTCALPIYRYGEALVDFTRAIELNPNDSADIALRGQTYGYVGQHEEALTDFTRALEINSDDTWILAERG